MTPDELLEAIEDAYAPQVELLGQYPVPVPANVTPIQWHVAYTAKSVENVQADGFNGLPAAINLAHTAASLELNRFAKLTIQDRPAAEVKSQNGAGTARKRERAFIVHALGWSE